MPAPVSPVVPPVQPVRVTPEPKAPRRPAGHRRKERRLKAHLLVGGVLLLAGVIVLGYVGWQMLGTTWIGHRDQDQAAASLQERWAEQAPGKDGRRAAETVQPGHAFAMVRIPRFGTGYAMPLIEGVDDRALSRGLGHIPDSVRPGDAGNFVIAGHRVTHGEPLRDMPDLEPGDQVIVETRDMVYTYVLDTDPEDLVVPFSTGWVLDAAPVNPDPKGPAPVDSPGAQVITVVTCSALFSTDDRMVAFGHLAAAVAK